MNSQSKAIVIFKHSKLSQDSMRATAQPLRIIALNKKHIWMIIVLYQNSQKYWRFSRQFWKIDLHTLIYFPSLLWHPRDVPPGHTWLMRWKQLKHERWWKRVCVSVDVLACWSIKLQARWTLRTFCGVGIKLKQSSLSPLQSSFFKSHPEVPRILHIHSASVQVWFLNGKEKIITQNRNASSRSRDQGWVPLSAKPVCHSKRISEKNNQILVGIVSLCEAQTAGFY